jgi:hypothetical protein
MMPSHARSVVGRSRAATRLAFATLAIGLVGTAVVAQDPSDKTFLERAKEYWSKVVSGMESTAKTAGDEYGKLKSEAAKATGPARAKLHAEMEAQGKKWAAAREKLVASIETHSQSVGDEIKKLEAKSANASGSAREKLHAESEKLHEELGIAREKLHAALAANMKGIREEYKHLKEQASDTSSDVKSKLEPRMEKLRADWAKNHDKLAEALKAEMKRIKDHIDHLGEATSSAAQTAKDKLLKKLHELQSKIDELAREKDVSDSK